MKEIKPPETVEKIGDRTSIFLAGSIEMGKAEDWQSMIPTLFEERKDLTFLNPRRDDWDSSWSQDESNPKFNEQVNWELDHLFKADYIFLYLSPETKSPISLLELGLFAESGKLIVCCPDGFWRKGNVDIICSRWGIPVFDTMDRAVGHLRTKLTNVK